jgi:acyl-homoserine lactone acylase PvdQ
MVRKLLAGQITWSTGRVADVVFSAEVYGAETWQARLAKVDPGMPFVQVLTGWDRRAEAASVPALAFYLFKMELGRDAAETEPPGSLSDARIRAALDRAKDRLELDIVYGASWGTLFRGMRDDARESYAVGGGTVTEAGMATPRTINFERRGAVNMGVSGQTAVQIVRLGKAVESKSVLMPGESDVPTSPFFDDQARELFGKGLTKPAYFGDRRELERHASSKIELKF